VTTADGREVGFTSQFGNIILQFPECLGLISAAPASRLNSLHNAGNRRRTEEPMALGTANDILTRHYLEIRCGLLDIAAALDRVSRAAGADAAQKDPRMDEIRKGLEIVSSTGTDRAERIQMLFSDKYVPGWNKRSSVGY
jgi:hypothetical protein